MKTVLIVSGNPANLEHISAHLSGSYRTLIAKSGKQALTIAATRLPDLILLDSGMPDMDGFAALEALRQNGTLRHIPVIFLTARHDLEMEARALEAGVGDFVTEPFARSVLLHRIGLQLRLAQYQRDIEKTVHDLEDSIITAFAELIECRDEKNGGHVQRTREYVAALGEMILREGLFPDDLDEQVLDMIVRAAPLHDIGKIGISDSIMLKPDALTENEYETIKKHTVIGARALGCIYERTPTQHYLRYAVHMAAGHHERYDGTGYPCGLAGEDIPFCCRLVAVANVYDALVTETVYRPAMSHEDACGIIAAGRGREFDPRIVDAFMKDSDAFAAIVVRNR